MHGKNLFFVHFFRLDGEIRPVRRQPSMGVGGARKYEKK